MNRRNFLKAIGATFAPVNIAHPSLREQDDLPSFEEMASDLDDETLAVAAEGDGWRAIAHTDISGESYGAPFPVRTVGNISNEAAGAALSDEFDSQVNNVFERIEQSDDPLETIMEMEPDL